MCLVGRMDSVVASLFVVLDIADSLSVGEVAHSHVLVEEHMDSEFDILVVVEVEHIVEVVEMEHIVEVVEVEHIVEVVEMEHIAEVVEAAEMEHIVEVDCLSDRIVILIHLVEMVLLSFYTLKIRLLQ